MPPTSHLQAFMEAQGHGQDFQDLLQDSQEYLSVVANDSTPSAPAPVAPAPIAVPMATPNRVLTRSEKDAIIYNRIMASGRTMTIACATCVKKRGQKGFENWQCKYDPTIDKGHCAYCVKRHYVCEYKEIDQGEKAFRDSCGVHVSKARKKKESVEPAVKAPNDPIDAPKQEVNIVAQPTFTAVNSMTASSQPASDSTSHRTRHEEDEQGRPGKRARREPSYDFSCDGCGISGHNYKDDKAQLVYQYCDIRHHVAYVEAGLNTPARAAKAEEDAGLNPETGLPEGMGLAQIFKEADKKTGHMWDGMQKRLQYHKK